jgi:hypothetical protein
MQYLISQNRGIPRQGIFSGPSSLGEDPVPAAPGYIAPAGLPTYQRVPRSALGYSYWAIDISDPVMEQAAVGLLGGMHLTLSSRTGTPIPDGMECAQLQPGPPASADASNALAWVDHKRAAGVAVLLVVATDGRVLMTATGDVSKASQITNATENAAVMFEPSGGWSSPGAVAAKAGLYVALGIGGVALLGGLVYLATRKPSRTPNRSRRHRRAWR